MQVTQPSHTKASSSVYKSNQFIFSIGFKVYTSIENDVNIINIRLIDIYAVRLCFVFCRVYVPSTYKKDLGIFLFVRFTLYGGSFCVRTFWPILSTSARLFCLRSILRFSVVLIAHLIESERFQDLLVVIKPSQCSSCLHNDMIPLCTFYFDRKWHHDFSIIKLF